MAFEAGQRVECAGSPIHGTVERDDGTHVWVKWDDGKDGILAYDRAVAFNAYRLIGLRPESR